MPEILPGAILVLLLIVLAALVVLVRRPAATGYDSLERSLDRLERGLREEMARNREELSNSLRAFSETVVRNMAEMSSAQGAGLTRLTQATEQRLEAIRSAIDERLKTLQQENAAKLEQMRRTVDEQLQGTLEKRLGESFRLVSERLEQVYRGLGEMRTLAAGVGDLKRALTNVRVRGSWGEIQLGALLEDTLHPDQYERNVATTGTAERVEFAVRLPGAEQGSTVYLPIDAKFPIEDYHRMLDAAERGEAAEVEACAKQLEQRIRLCAKDIRDKYVAPPATTDFGIMYLPTESLYAEVLRRPGLVETLQRDFRVAVTGPTTLAAFLNSLQMGFRTLAIQQRSGEVWELLGAVKTEFARYAEVLQKVQKKLQEAANTVDRGLVRTRQIERKLRTVEALSPAEAGALLPEANGAEVEDEDRAGIFEETGA